MKIFVIVDAYGPDELVEPSRVPLAAIVRPDSIWCTRPGASYAALTPVAAALAMKPWPDAVACAAARSSAVAPPLEPEPVGELDPHATTSVAIATQPTLRTNLTKA